MDCAGDGRLLLSKMESKELGVDDCAACSQVHTCPNLLCNTSLVSGCVVIYLLGQLTTLALAVVVRHPCQNLIYFIVIENFMTRSAK